jgi:16S rRNA (cytosine967-C5)-methyltransferase
LFCTCSVFKAEGRDQIDAFLQRCGEAEVAQQPVSPGHLLPLPDNDREHPPPENDADSDASGDGFFYTLMQKRAV